MEVANDTPTIIANGYYNAGYKYRANGYANMFGFFSGYFTVQTAPSGNAGDALTLTEKLRVANDGTITIASLAGTGTRAVLAAASGVLSAPVSDEKLKTNITPINSSVVMDMLKDPKIQAINYTWKDESKGSDVELGMTYQMLEPHHIKGLTFYDNEIGGINYDRLCVVLWEQNKQLLARIEKLEQK